jgi:hypothetical protein
MHIGDLALFEGQPPDLDEFLAHIEASPAQLMALAGAGASPA